MDSFPKKKPFTIVRPYHIFELKITFLNPSSRSFSYTKLAEEIESQIKTDFGAEEANYHVETMLFTETVSNLDQTDDRIVYVALNRPIFNYKDVLSKIEGHNLMWTAKINPSILKKTKQNWSTGCTLIIQNGSGWEIKKDNSPEERS